MKSKIGKGEWVLLYAVTGGIDAAQFLIGFFGAWLSMFAVGLILIAINDAADPIIGVALAVYFQLRGVSLLQHPSRLFSLLGVAVIDEGTGGIASVWIADIWYIHRTVRKEEAESRSAEASDPSRREPDIELPLITRERREPPPRIVQNRESNIIHDIDFRPRGGREDIRNAA